MTREIFYVGVRSDRAGGQDVFIEIIDDDIVSRTRLDPRPSQKTWNHSPDGFEWGYGGSGPAQLALAILMDAMCHPYKSTKTAEDLAVKHYQAFKFSFVTLFPREGFRLGLEEVLDFVRQQEGLDKEPAPGVV